MAHSIWAARTAADEASGGTGTLSARWPLVLAGYHRAAVACRRIGTSAPGLEISHRGLLSRGEQDAYAALAAPQARRLEWLAGRVAVKECVAELLGERLGEQVPATDIVIVAGERGAPAVRVPGLERHPVFPAVSLTNTRGRVAALAALVAERGGAGLDIELVTERTMRLATRALDGDERGVLKMLSGQGAGEWALRLWCAREAAGKALGSGLAGGALSPRASEVDVDTGAVLVRLHGRSVTVLTTRDRDIIVASAVLWGAQSGGIGGDQQPCAVPSGVA